MIGWVGSVLLVIAFALVSVRALSSQSHAFQLLNAVGSLFLAWNALVHRAYPSAFTNIVWLGIALGTAGLVFRRRLLRINGGISE